MKSKLFKLIFIFLTIFCFNISIKAYSYVNENTNYQVIIEDDAYLLTNDEILSLVNDMKPLTEYGNIAFKSINQNRYTSSYFAEKYYYEIFGTSSGTLFLIDMDNRYIYIYSDGSNYRTITNDKADIITDNVYKYASNQDYYECAKEAFNQVNILLSGGKIAEPMRYISNILLSFILVFLINFIIILFKSKIKIASEEEIISNCNIKFNVNNIAVYKVGNHRVYSPRTSSSGGSSSGGSSGGGSSSGGGGGHRF